MFSTKHAPQAFADLVFENDITRKKLEHFIEGARTGNILLHGPYGSGKSALAQVIATQTRRDVMFGFADMQHDTLNCAELRREDLDRIARGWHMSGQHYAYAVLDEFDLLHHTLQAAVRAVMDRYEGRHGFILTTNNLRRVDGAIQSRCEVIELPALSPAALLPVCRRILVAEGIQLEDEHILSLISHEHGDMRQVLRQLESLVFGVNRKTSSAA